MSNQTKIYDVDGKVLHHQKTYICFSNLSANLREVLANGGKPKYLSYILSPTCDFWRDVGNRQRFTEFVLSLYHFGELGPNHDEDFLEFTVDLENVSGFDAFALFVALRYMEEFGVYTKKLFNYTDNFDLSPKEAFIIFHYLGLDGNYNHHFYGRKETYHYNEASYLNFKEFIKLEPEIPEFPSFLKQLDHVGDGLWNTYSHVPGAENVPKQKALAREFLLERANDKAVKTEADIYRILTQ